MAKQEWAITGFYGKDSGRSIPGVFNVYDTEETAKRVYEEKADHIHKTMETEDIRVMTLDDFIDKKKYAVLGDAELREIDHESYYQALEVLPPRFTNKHGVNGFLMTEFLTGTITHMYVEKEGRYFQRLVDAADADTWIKPDQIEALVAKRDAEGPAQTP